MTRRKSTRNATKKATPEKPPVKRTRRQSRRNKRSSSVSSEASDDEPLKNVQNTESTADETQSTITDADSDDDSVPLAELDVRRNRRQTKISLKEETANSRPRRGRSQGSPAVKDTVQEDELIEESEERKGKGKSKSKIKSKSEQPATVEPDNQTNHDVSENVQVTTQSPTKPVDIQCDNITVQCESDVAQSNDESVIKSVENEAQLTENSTNLVSDQAETVDEENESKEIEPEPVETKNESNSEEIAPENENNTKYVQERSFIENEIADSPKDYEKDDSNVEEKSNEDADSQSETNTVPETENLEEKSADVVKSVKSPERKRRNSSISLTNKDEKEVERPKTSRKIKLNRNFSTETKEQSEQQRTPDKKAKWGSADILTSIVGPVQKVDVVTLKTVCPSLEFLSENEVKLEDVPVERKNSVSESENRLNRLSTDNEESEKQEVPEKNHSNSENNEEGENTTNIIAINRKISIVDDTASKLRPPPSPARNPPSDVLFITNLVRPFTLKQLKELLQRTGNVKEEGFWTDRIKSKCYVQYDSQEEAEATRNALHGVHWPIGNGKKLMIEYANVEDLEMAKNPPAPPVVPIPEVPEKTVEKENKEPERRVSEGEHNKDVHEREEKRKRSEGHVREWDVGKEDLHRRRSRSRERGRKNRRSASPREDFISKKQRKEEDAVPQKLMDDLFLKTKATPSIYWQPLSPEEIATKQQQRLIRMEEHKRRMEESSRVRDRSRRGGSFRRR